MPSFQTISSVERLAHAHPDRADDLSFDRDWIQRATAIVRCPDFVDGDFAGLFVHADFGNLGRVGISRRRSDACAFVLAAAGILRRRVGTGSAERAVEVDGGDHGFLERQLIFGAFVFALLLQRTAQDLAFDPARDRSFRLGDWTSRELRAHAPRHSSC